MAILTQSVTGLSEQRQRIAELIVTQPQKFRQGLIEAGLLLQRESQQIVPIDTGNLKRTAETRDVTAEGSTEYTVIVVYSTRYAIYVHENLMSRHAEGKSAKFLERPARENLQRFIEVIVNRLRS